MLYHFMDQLANQLIQKKMKIIMSCRPTVVAMMGHASKYIPWRPYRPLNIILI